MKGLPFLSKISSSKNFYWVPATHTPCHESYLVVLKLGKESVITFFVWPPLEHILSCSHCRIPLLQTPFCLWMTSPFRNPIQTAKMKTKRTLLNVYFCLSLENTPYSRYKCRGAIYPRVIENNSATTLCLQNLTVIGFKLFLFIFFLFLFYYWGVQKVAYYLHRFWVELRTAQLLPSLYLTANAAQVALAWEPFDSCSDLNEYFKDVVLFWYTRQQNKPRLRKTETYDNVVVLLQRLTYKATGCDIIFLPFFATFLPFSESFKTQSRPMSFLQRAKKHVQLAC